MKKELRPTFAKNLIKAREAMKWNQFKAADMLGITRVAYASYEEGRANPDISLLPLIAYTFKITNLISFLDNENFSHRDQDGGFSIEISTPLEEKYQAATPVARRIVDLTLGIGNEAVTC
jgi:transcriptional regulator with XRE-family HTH domain